jgi:asparaginyl-tRNA synthetase
MAKKKQSFEFLREKGHLRPRTNSIGAIARIRSALAYATHSFFKVSGIPLRTLSFPSVVAHT